MLLLEHIFGKSEEENTDWDELLYEKYGIEGFDGFSKLAGDLINFTQPLIDGDRGYVKELGSGRFLKLATIERGDVFTDACQ